MKTAMQEHIEWLKENQLYFNIPIEVIDNAEDLLGKERKQMLDAIMFHNTDPFSDLKIYAEQYLNKTYNK